MVMRPGGPIKTALAVTTGPSPSGHGVSSLHSYKMRPVRIAAWQRLTRSHRLFVSSYCQPVFLPFRFRPSSESSLVYHILRTHIQSQQHAVMELLLAQSLELGMRLTLNVDLFPFTH